jgi:hypothetical protein
MIAALRQISAFAPAAWRRLVRCRLGLNIYSLKSYKKALAAMKARWANRENEKAPADDEAEDAA